MGFVTFIFSVISVIAQSDIAVALFFIPILMAGGLQPSGRLIVIVVGVLVLLITHIFAYGAEIRESLHLTEFAIPFVVIAATGAVAPILYRITMQWWDARAEAKARQPQAPPPQQ
ncbi:MAG: hypothetical protein O2854_00595 [Chloroflexi bacterium]|nr:hypothetical protein [Chloroflexota bacterium]